MLDPVSDWATDFEIFDDEYVRSPFEVWDELRERCPIAHTNRRASTWLPTRYDDVVALARDIEHFSSRGISVVPPVEPVPGPGGGTAHSDEVETPTGPFLAGLPPISADPPDHTWTRRLLLPWFSHQRVAGYEPGTRELCQRLIAEFQDTGRADAAEGYSQQIPVRVISWLLGVPETLSDTFTGWVRDLLEFADDTPRREAARDGVAAFLLNTLEDRRSNPGDDLISSLLHAEVPGVDVGDEHVLGIAALTLIAGVDTTWSAIGSSLWHLATHPEDQARLRENPEMLPIAVEEFLRAYSPVTMGRLVVKDTEFGGCPMREGDRLLMNFPAANRDPEQFDDPDQVVLDRMNNRHIAFGVGIHRCAGSNLARMELLVAIEEFLRGVPEFRLDPSAEVTWAGGQVRGPRQLPILF